MIYYFYEYINWMMGWDKTPQNEITMVSEPSEPTVTEIEPSEPDVYEPSEPELKDIDKQTTLKHKKKSRY